MSIFIVEKFLSQNDPLISWFDLNNVYTFTINIVKVPNHDRQIYLE